mmetsp:Transcript_68564/g.149828  ORF Transcript_68564/g.149828 Transcript_68564/m.149828 type:complete len:491 (+) Transcript_68564:225-1697(+)
MAHGGAVSNSYIFSEPPHRNRFHVATRPVPGSFSARLPAAGDSRGRVDEGQEILRRAAALQAGILDADGKLGFERHKPERVRRMKAIHQNRAARLGNNDRARDPQVRLPIDEFDWASRVSAKLPHEDSLASTAASTASTHFPRLQPQHQSPHDSRGFEAWGDRGQHAALSPRYVEDDPLRTLAPPPGRPRPAPESSRLRGGMAPPKLGAITPSSPSKPAFEPWEGRSSWGDQQEPSEVHSARSGGRPRPSQMTRAELFKRQQERRQKAESAAALEAALSAKRRAAEEEQQNLAVLKDDSARRIQASYNHHRLRTEIATRHARRQEENLAAAKIQAIHRGREVRKRQAAGEDLTYIHPISRPPAAPFGEAKSVASVVEQDDTDSEADVIGVQIGALLNFTDDSNRSTPFSMTRSDEASPDLLDQAARPTSSASARGPSRRPAEELDPDATGDSDDEPELADFAKLMLGLAVDDMDSNTPKSMTSVSNSGVF